jgi:hypothetical protein
MASLTRWLVLGVVLAAAPAAGQPPTTSDPTADQPVRVKALLEAAPSTALRVPASTTANDVTASSLLLAVSPDPLPPCAGGNPRACPVLPAITGIVPGPQPDGRLVIVRNTGHGLLALPADAPESAPANRLATGRILQPGEIALLVYDEAKGRWAVLGAPEVRDIALPPGAVRR